MRKVILNIHLVIALVAGAFTVILGVTGAVLAFEPELDRLQNRKGSYVTPSGKSLSLVEIGAAVSQKYPGESVVAYLPSEAPGMATQVILSRGIVSVNQYTGQILAVRIRGQSLLGGVRSLHVRLAMGDLGRVILKWSSVGLLVSLLTGLYLWWPVKRMRIGGSWWSARFWYDLHSSIGFFSLIPALLLAGTGVVIGFENQLAWILEKVSRSSAVEVEQTRPAHKAETGIPGITPDQAVAIASSQVPDTVAYRVQMPRYGGLYVVALDDPRNRVTGRRNFISVYPVDGRIASANLSSNLNFPARLIALNNAIHTGNILGAPSKIVAALTSLLLPVQAVSGLLIWLRRKGLLHAR